MGVLVFVEDAGDELSQQAVAFARMIAGDRDDSFVAVSISGDYAPAAWGQTLADLIADRGPSAVIAPGSDRGNEVLAHAAAILDLPLSTNTTAFAAGDPPTVTRVRWGGSLLEEALLRAPTLLMTVAPHAVAADTAAVEVELVTASEHALAVVPTKRVGAASGGISLEDAKVVVSGGRGVGSSEGFAVIEELAGLLGGAAGCSRAVTSAGWRPHSDQVGQTGTKVAPEIYIACGISGATQHMAGCKGAKRLLAINADGEASIFAHADYGVIGDLHTVLPAVVAELRKVRGT
jgi:electron transfer flavoprotein alpha subunit